MQWMHKMKEWECNKNTKNTTKNYKKNYNTSCSQQNVFFFNFFPNVFHQNFSFPNLEFYVGTTFLIGQELFPHLHGALRHQNHRVLGETVLN